jgi:hypothetical protein
MDDLYTRNNSPVDPKSQKKLSLVEMLRACKEGGGA